MAGLREKMPVLHPSLHAKTSESVLIRPESAQAGLWHVLQTKSRQEKILSQELSARGIEHFLPLHRRISYYGSRKISVELPLFPGYLFLHGSLDDVYRADRSKRVAKIIHVSQQDHLERELDSIRLAIEGCATLDPYPYLRTGARAEVRSGPMRGLQGVVQERLGVTRLVLRIDMLGQAVSMEIDASLLDPIE